MNAYYADFTKEDNILSVPIKFDAKCILLDDQTCVHDLILQQIFKPIEHVELISTLGKHFILNVTDQGLLETSEQLSAVNRARVNYAKVMKG